MFIQGGINLSAVAMLCRLFFACILFWYINWHYEAAQLSGREASRNDAAQYFVSWHRRTSFIRLSCGWIIFHSAHRQNFGFGEGHDGHLTTRLAWCCNMCWFMLIPQLPIFASHLAISREPSGPHWAPVGTQVEYKGLDPALVAELQGPSGGRTWGDQRGCGLVLLILNATRETDGHRYLVNVPSFVDTHHLSTFIV